MKHLLITSLCLLLTRTTLAADGPFASAFDRFARHGEIGDATAGRLLLSDLSCTACHKSDSDSVQPKGGPNLHAAGSRLQAAWLQEYFFSPEQTHPGTTMPDVLAALPLAEKRAAAKALTAFLMSQTKAFPEIKATGAVPVPPEFWKRGDVGQGRALYHQIGCVACHDADKDYEVAEMKPSPTDQLLKQLDPEDIEEMGLQAAARQIRSVPHSNLAQKYSPLSLTFFLLNPDSVRPGGRMPSFGLSPVDAANIAAWLIDRDRTAAKSLRSQQPTTRPHPTLVARGKQLFQELKCANCHAVADLKAGPPAKSLNELRSSAQKSCISEPASGLPNYRIDEIQRRAINAAITEERAGDSGPADPLQLTLLKQNCYGCHERDTRGGVGRFRKPYFETVGHVDIGDEGRLPPPLTGVGAKLKTPWLATVLKGKGAVRTHMFVRMPEFPQSFVGQLPNQFAKADQKTKPRSEADVFGKTDKLADAGGALMNVGCVQCHSFRGEALPGTVGIDMEGVASRVHPQWLHDFLMNPGALKPRTRMPTFFPNGRSQNKDVLAGDSEQQIAAMWAYLKDIQKQPLPEKIEEIRKQNFELTPTHQPIVLRTFMPEAGTHAIAVGFPQKVHFAFDAENMRFAEAWRGRFLDAEGTWFSRFTPPAKPVGDQVIRLPVGVPLAFSDDEEFSWPDDAVEAGYRFGGYRLTADRVPVFLYRIGDARIEDTMTATKDRGLNRTITIRRAADDLKHTLWLRAHTGDTLKHTGIFSQRNEAGLTVFVKKGIIEEGSLARTELLTEYVMPVPSKLETVIEVEYRW